LASLVESTVPKLPKLASKSSYVISSHVPADCNDRSLFQEIIGLVALFPLIFLLSECATPEDDDVGWILTQSKSIKERRKAREFILGTNSLTVYEYEYSVNQSQVIE
jgi:hypothetical protein